MMDRAMNVFIKSLIIDRKFENFNLSLETNNPSINHITFFKVKLSYENCLIGECGIRVVRFQKETGNEDLNEWEKRAVIEWLFVETGFEKLGVEFKLLFELKKFAELYNITNIVVRVDDANLVKNKKNDIVLDKSSMKKIDYHLFSREKESSSYILNIS